MLCFLMKQIVIIQLHILFLSLSPFPPVWSLKIWKLLFQRALFVCPPNKVFMTDEKEPKIFVIFFFHFLYFVPYNQWYRKLNGFDDKNNLQCSFERCFCESCKFFNRKMSRILIGYAEVSVFFSVLFKWQHFNCQTESIL